MNILFYLVKILNILYIGIFYFIIGSVVASIVTKIYPDRNKEDLKKLTSFRLYCETVFTSSLLFLIIYFCRKIVKYIGSPFDNIAGFDFYRLKELNGGIVLSLSIILFSPKLINMTREISERITTKENVSKNKIKTDIKLICLVVAILIFIISTYIIRYRSGAIYKKKISSSSNKANTVGFNSNSGNSSNGI